jgi:lysozyme family protein
VTDTEIVELVLRHEGVWDDNPTDAGGRTAYGISSRYHPEAWANGPPTREQAIAIYLSDYVAPFWNVDPDVKPQLVDIAVNSGVSTARALYAVAQANHGSRAVSTQLAIERLKYYARLVKAKPTQSVFLLGWTNRAVSFLL